MLTNRSAINSNSSNEDDKTNKTPLPGLLSEICDAHIFPRLLLKEHGLFATVSVDFERASAFTRLMSAAVNAEPESYQQEDETKLAAIAILKRHPELLFKIGFVTDHYGRKILASPYQLFCGTFDVWALSKIHTEILPLIENGAALAQAQFQAQFPNCPWPLAPNINEEALYDARNIAQIQSVSAQLQKIDAMIAVDPCTKAQATREETINAILALNILLKPKENEVIKTGLHFPSGIQRKIYELYEAKLRDLINSRPNAWSCDQLAFFSREVIGSMEDALTSVDGQCVKTGLGKMNISNGPDRCDGLSCSHPKGIPAEATPLKGKLGRTVMVDPYSGYSYLLISQAGNFELYNKYGETPCSPMPIWCSMYTMARGECNPLLSNLWKTKAELYRSHYTPRLIDDEDEMAGAVLMRLNIS